MPALWLVHRVVSIARPLTGAADPSPPLNWTGAADPSPLLNWTQNDDDDHHDIVMPVATV